MNGYLVYDAKRGYLQLNGPFAYAEWVSEQPRATQMAFAKAHAFALAYGSGEAIVVPVGWVPQVRMAPYEGPTGEGFGWANIPAWS